MAPLPDLSFVRAMIIDLDGVLWRGSTPLPGLQEFVSLLRAREIRFVLASNNATASPESVQTKLAGMGVGVSTEEVLTSCEAAAAYLLERFPNGAPVLPVGESGLKAALEQAGFRLVDRADAAVAVVVGLDRTVSWDLLTEAAYAIRAGALFVGANPDVTFPTERGLAPGSGALLAALQAATGMAPTIVGKPEPPLYRLAMSRLASEPDHTLALGDRLETDILGAQRAHLRSALVLTGVTSPHDLERSTIRPDFVFDGLPELCRALQGGSD